MQGIQSMQEIKFKREVFEGGKTTEISLIFDYMWTVWLFSTFRNFCFYYNAVFPVQSLLAFSTTPETKGIDAFLLKFVMVKVMALEISFSLLFLNYHVILKGQLISECLFDNFKFSKKPTKSLTDFCPRI